MTDSCSRAGRTFGAMYETVNLTEYYNWPRDVPSGEWWQKLADEARECPTGLQCPWGIPFEMWQGTGPSIIAVTRDIPEVVIPLDGRANFVCFLHTWQQIPGTVHTEDPAEGLAVGKYQLEYEDGGQHVQLVQL